MSDLIKKIKIKKQDGTFTDYIPIGAEAKNISTTDGSNVEYNIQSIKKQVENIKDSLINDDLVTYEIIRDENIGTTYYLTKIANTNSEGNRNILRVGVAKDSPTASKVEAPSDFALRKNSPFTMNAGIFYSNTSRTAYGLVIQNGEILKDELSSISPSTRYPYILGIKANGDMKSYKISSSLTAQTILNDGCVDAIVGFYPIFENGVECDRSSYPTGLEDLANPAQVVCQLQDRSYLILTCDGRTSTEAGLTLEQRVAILRPFNPIFGFCLDGGGSTSTIVNFDKINKDIDGGGTIERKVATMLYLPLEVKNLYGEIKKLENNFNNLYIPTMKYNLYNSQNRTNWQKNKYVDEEGIIQNTESDCSLTDLYPCPENKNIVISGNTDWSQVYFYDEDKNFISKVNFNPQNPFKTPAKTAYIRSIVRNTLVEEYCVVVEDEYSGWKPYYLNDYDVLYNTSQGENGVSTVDLNKNINWYNRYKVFLSNPGSLKQEAIEFNNKAVNSGSSNLSRFGSIQSMGISDTSGWMIILSARVYVVPSAGQFVCDRNYTTTKLADGTWNVEASSQTNGWYITRIEAYYN